MASLFCSLFLVPATAEMVHPGYDRSVGENLRFFDNYLMFFSTGYEKTVALLVNVATLAN